MLETIQFNIPKELAMRIQLLERQLPQILELGLKGFNASAQPAFDGAAEVFDFLASLPSPEEIIKLRPSEALQNRVSILLEKNRTGRLTPEEEKEWENYQYIEHLVRMAKARAHLKLKSS
ncbi:MAG: hypothetical protein V2A69_11615 [Pseudomonadota bacterium]